VIGAQQCVDVSFHHRAHQGAVVRGR
jgi:hypothetical protein